jgi:hypothetical protein
MEYVVMLQRAWQILTRHKIFWLFGLIAVLAGQDALFNVRNIGRLQPVTEAIVSLPVTAANIVRSITATGSDLVLIALMIIAGLVLLFVGMLANAAMIGLTQSAERGDAVDLKSGLRVGVQHIDRLIIIRLIFNIPLVILSLLGFYTMVRVVDPTIAGLGYQQALSALQDAGLLPIFLVTGLIIGIFIGAIGVGADRAVVIDGMGVIAALRQGWDTLRDNLGRYFVITGIFVSTILLFTLIVACPVAVLFADRIASLTQTAPLNVDLTATLLNDPVGVVVLVIGLVLYSAVTAFAAIVWTIAYRRYAK